MKAFLVADDYGQGAVWAYVRAPSKAAVQASYPTVVVVDQPPDWMTDDYLAALGATMTFDLADRRAPFPHGAATVEPHAASEDIAVDLGSTTWRIQVKGGGTPITEPSLVAIDETGRVRAVGEEARKLVDRTPGGLRAIHPFTGGVTSDARVADAMVRFVLERAALASHRTVDAPRLLLSVPTDARSAEMRTIRDAALKAGAYEAYLIEAPLSAAIGANVPISGPKGNMVVDLGGASSEVAVIALGGIVISTSLRIGGNDIDQAIAAYIRRKYNMMVGDRTAEDLKIAIGSALPVDPEVLLDVRGRDLMSGLPRAVTVTSRDVLDAMEVPLQELVAAVRRVVDETPTELLDDIKETGMILAGGGALLRNVDRFLTDLTGIRARVVENPATATLRGIVNLLGRLGPTSPSQVEFPREALLKS